MALLEDKKKLMDENALLLESMLDEAIVQLVDICNENETWLVDDGRLCKTYEDVFNCLKHWSEKK